MKLFHRIAITTLGVVLASSIGAGVAHYNRGDMMMARAADKSIVNTFSADTMGTSVSSYTATWDNTSGTVLTLTNFNNNKKAWNLVKAGRNGNASVATITTKSALSESIKSVKVTVDSVTVANVNSAKLYISSNSDFATKTTIEPDAIKSGTMTYTISSPAASKYYQLEYDLKSGSSNGFLVISKVEYVYESSAVLQSIALQKDNSTVKTQYYNGDDVSFTGIKAIGTYSDSTNADLTGSCTITADKAKVAVGDTSITYSAVYNLDNTMIISDFVLSIAVDELVITKIEKNGNYRTEFVQKQKFSYGTGTVKVTWNSGATKTLKPTDAGVTTMIGSTNITGLTHYMTLADDGEDLVISYAGFSFTVGTISVTPYVEPASGYWSPITNVSDLYDGLEVIIVASNHEFAMGKYSTGNNIAAIDIAKDGESKISSSIPGVQVYTLEESDAVSNTFAFNDGSAYLAATGGTSNNYLKTESAITSASSFAITINAGVMSIVGQASSESNARMTMRFNNSDLVFSCYGSTSTVGSLACLYKFTAQSKTPDQLAVESFVKTSLYLDDSSLDYIDPNNQADTGACRGDSGYYKAAKQAYLALTDDQKEIFKTSADTLIVWGRARLTAWATANQEIFDVNAGTFTPVVSPSVSFMIKHNNPAAIIIVTAAIVTISLAGVFFIIRKRKHQ